MQIIGFDSKRVKRKTTLKNPNGDDHLFEACLGVGVTVNRFEDFAKKYEETMQNLFEKNGFEYSRKIYKAADIRGKFMPIGVDAINILFQELSKHVSYVDIFYSYFFDVDRVSQETLIAQPKTVGINWGNPNKYKKISGFEFLDIIDPGYPLICAYAHSSKHTMKVSQKLVLDGCSIKPCGAWRYCVGEPNLSIIPSGDRCNHVISSADLFASAIDERLSRENIKLNPTVHSDIFEIKNKAHTTFIGEKWLHSIKPQDDFNVDIRHKLAHPVFVVFSPKNSPSGREGKTLLENSPLMTHVLNAAAKKGGSVKFYETNDVKYLSAEDYLITHSEEASKSAEELVSVGIQSKRISFDELKTL